MITSNCISPPNNSANPSLDVVGVDERIGVGLKSFAAIQRLLACPAKLALAIRPCVLRPLEPDIARLAREACGNRVRAVGVLRAIQAAARQQAGEMGDADPKYLLCEDVIDALLEVRNLARQTLSEAAGDLAQEHARLRERVKEPN